MKRLLCAIDHSEPSLRAAKAAADLAGKCNAELVLLNIVRLPDAAQSELTDYLRQEHEADPPGVAVVEAAYDRLRLLTDHLAGAGASAVPITCDVRAGDAAPEIVTAAQDHASDLIVVGHRGQNRIARVLLGSVARTVLETAPCPVLVVR